MMLKLIVASLLVFLPVAWSTTCTDCKTEYGTAKTNASSDNTVKCTVLSSYLTCLGTSAKGDAGCPLPTDDAAAIETDYTNASCSSTDTCVCQKTFWATAQADDAATCMAYKAELNCLSSAKTPTGCDGTTTKSAIATTAETARASLTNASADMCPAPTSTCQCEIDAAKGDNSDSTKYCNVLTTLRTCLSLITNTTEPGCTAVTHAALVTSTGTKYTSAQCAADHVTFVMTSLVLSLLATVFL
ncbi:uncharacterized protein LOC124281804 isoform X1 [Haliotis rubra]|uniref:uncharacterized protein LOC124281804 isoform X1 n=1 Tax=Haliotis rubra TaxID=36100 RepID=UPI001EE56F2A|nr:uncharacterized protein LOC124281804 isoform X1 [Haliotis rubra]